MTSLLPPELISPLIDTGLNCLFSKGNLDLSLLLESPGNFKLLNDTHIASLGAKLISFV